MKIKLSYNHITQYNTNNQNNYYCPVSRGDLNSRWHLKKKFLIICSKLYRAMYGSQSSRYLQMKTTQPVVDNITCLPAKNSRWFSGLTSNLFSMSVFKSLIPVVLDVGIAIDLPVLIILTITCMMTAMILFLLYNVVLSVEYDSVNLQKL